MFSAPIPENEVDRLATLYRYSILDTPPEQGYEDVTALAAYICAAPYSTITFIDADRQWFKSELGVGSNESNRNESFCACALLDTRPLIVEDTHNDPRFAGNRYVVGEPKIRFYAGAPLVAPNGQILGTVCVFDTKPRVLSSSQVEALVSLSRQVMALLAAKLRGTEIDRAAVALVESEKLLAVGRLASSVAHGINNPLEAVINLLYLLKGKVTDDEGRVWLDQAEQELRRVSVIANQTLQFHKQASHPQMVTCTDLFSAVLDAYEARLTNARVVIEKRKRADQPVLCFEGDIRQVLGNIISNAIDAMPTGGKLLLRSRMGTRWKTGQKGIVLTIADSGMGMDSETDKRKFEAFFSTKGIGGIGLGLWISADIMHRHRGEIMTRTSRCSRSHGTVVQLFLPVLVMPDRVDDCPCPTM